MENIDKNMDKLLRDVSVLMKLKSEQDVNYNNIMAGIHRKRRIRIWGGIVSGCAAAVILAMNNLRLLPQVVGINLMSDGNFSMVLGRLPAVLAPLVVTAVCLLLMFCSKRTLTPWLVSVFSLALPLIILVINVFPA